MLQVLPYESRHQSGVLSLIVNIQRNEFGVSITAEEQPDLMDIEDYYQSGAGNFWVAMDVEQDLVVGTVSLLDIGAGQGALRKMFVHKDYRGGQMGVAAKLLQTLVQWCEEKKVHEIFLGTTPQFLAAHRFYEKNRFTEVSPADLPQSFPVMAVDKKFYKRQV
ncbi:GNAT family N-acetyltransferase [Hahella sp. KA22]|uniref:GNAT family N-acetyltransferase n=1 Tax=Hahella sp. KA22 TaxID=1628392 RepID=UPI000FDF5760|nr:GNAT family N-acetyltransferase [Hahella sp. KA22]AZZ95061.1 GNAT family N-acetyltransferase [Hahella sp. KA22]QAY52706.1 GNAT family N-acetyltransferase [Hahella sp. KA22]